MKFTFVNCNQTKYSKEINQILNAALLSVDPFVCVKKLFQIRNKSLFNTDFDLNDYDNVYLIGMGKGVIHMAMGLVSQIGDRINKGVLIAKNIDMVMRRKFPKFINVLIGDHPFPSERSVYATSLVMQLAQSAKENDLVICLISGGGSALLTMPVEGIKIRELQDLTYLLLKAGADINEINIIRKHLDQVKGGGLLKSIFPAKSVSLILSDVLGDEISLIASGPTVYDPSTFQDALRIINKYGLNQKVSSRIIKYIREGVAGKYPETIKENNPILKHHRNIVVGNLHTCAIAAATEAKKLGFITKLLPLNFSGEARQVGRELGVILKNIVLNKQSYKPICMIAGGEPTVKVKGSGKGGRNQEVALSAAMELDGLKDCLFLSLATDGEDGPTDAAGGIVNGETISEGIKLGLEPENILHNNDSYHFLQKTRSLIHTGLTGTNVNDLYLMIAY